MHDARQHSWQTRLILFAVHTQKSFHNRHEIIIIIITLLTHTHMLKYSDWFSKPIFMLATFKLWKKFKLRSKGCLGPGDAKWLSGLTPPDVAQKSINAGIRKAMDILYFVTNIFLSQKLYFLNKKIRFETIFQSDFWSPSWTVALASMKIFSLRSVVHAVMN